MSDDRLRRLLGSAELAGLRARLRARFERGELRDAFTLTELTVAERRALEGLLGRAPKTAGSMQLTHAQLDRAIARAALATDLRHALEMLDGPIVDRRGEQTRLEQAWAALIEGARDRSLRGLLGDPAGVGLLKRCAGSDAGRAAILLEETARVLARLPANGLSLAQLAAETLGDSHGLDAGQPVAALVLRACRADAPSEEHSVRLREPAGVSSDRLSTSDDERLEVEGNDENARDAVIASVRAQWARLGVAVNELAAPVLCLNLPTRGASAHDDLVRLAAREGEPVHLTLRVLLRRPPLWDVAGVAVFVCENPSIVAAAADRLRGRCAPMVCTDGMPAAAQRTLLQQLTAAGARLYYHGDFDWPGLRIGSFVMRTFGAAPWRFRASDYLTVAAATGPQLAPAQRVVATWDDKLADTMLARGFAVHEERSIESLLEDLAGSQDGEAAQR